MAQYFPFVLCAFPGNRGPFSVSFRLCSRSLVTPARPTRSRLSPRATAVREPVRSALSLSAHPRDCRPVTHACGSGNSKPRTPLPSHSHARCPFGNVTRVLFSPCASLNSRADFPSAIQSVAVFCDHCTRYEVSHATTINSQRSESHHLHRATSEAFRAFPPRTSSSYR